ncbi:MAG TPA: KH domain-containing protein [Kofleriaceae bacterium]|nr:KH domain-containing protein [Kofleriaceae bacterium]
MSVPGRASGSSAIDLGELIRYVTINLVDKADEVVVSLVQERDADVYEIEVGDDDLGQIIGKGGKTARAIRAVVSAAAPRSGKRTLVEILE